MCWDLPGREAYEARRAGMRGSMCAHVEQGRAGTCVCSREAPCKGGAPWSSSDASCEGTVGRGGTAAQRALLEFHALFVCIFFLGLIQVP